MSKKQPKPRPAHVPPNWPWDFIPDPPPPLAETLADIHRPTPSQRLWPRWRRHGGTE